MGFDLLSARKLLLFRMLHIVVSVRIIWIRLADEVLRMKTEKGASVELMSRLTADDDYAYAVANTVADVDADADC